MMEYELLEELARELNPEITPDEVTAQMVADYSGVSYSKASRMLKAKADAGLMVTRAIRQPDGHIAVAYRKS